MSNTRKVYVFGDKSERQAANERTEGSQETDSPRIESSNVGETRRRALVQTHTSTPDKHRKTPQSSGSHFTRNKRAQSEECKRKQSVTPSGSTPEKVRKTTQSSKFVNTLIGQWVKSTGAEVPLPQSDTPGESSIAIEEETEECEVHMHAIRSLKKKLHQAHGTITELYAWRDSELKLKDEIVTKINANWDFMATINKYSDDISDSLAVYREQYDSLSALYNDVIIAQRSAVKQLQQQLNNVKSKGDGNVKAVAAMEKKMKDQEKQMEEMQRILKKQLEEAECRLRMTKNHIESVHAEEKSAWSKERDELMTTIGQLETKLNKLEHEYRTINEDYAQKKSIIKNLEQEISEYKSKLVDLSSEHSELTEKFKASESRVNELMEELGLKTEKLNNLEKHLNERQKIEADLSKELDTIGSKTAVQFEQYKTLQANFTEVERKLEDMQLRNVDLENTIDNMKINNEYKTAELKQMIEKLENEKKNMLLEEQMKLQSIESARKSLKESHDMEISKVKNEHHKKVNELQSTITKQYADLTRLKDTLNKAYAENNNLQDKFYRMKESKQQLEIEMKNLVEVSKARFLMESVLNDSKRAKTTEDLPLIKETRSLVDEFTNDNIQERTSLSQPVRSEKKVRFTLFSPNKEDTEVASISSKSDISPTQPDSSQTREIKRNEKSGDAGLQKKFFKNRGSGVRQYANVRKGRGRK